MKTEEVRKLYRQLLRQPTLVFPKPRQPLKAPEKQGVYVIRNRNERVLHVGRTLTRKEGLKERLRDHLYGKSSFIRATRQKLRGICTYQYLVVPNDRKRALLEHYAIGHLCPKHLG